MVLKNYNKCLIFLSDFIEAKISYFDCPAFVNMYTNLKGDNSEGKLYLVYKFSSHYELSKKIEEISCNKTYYNKIPNIEVLTEREIEILRAICKGDVKKKIAKNLFISERTLYNHIQNIYDKLEVSNTVEAYNKAIKLGYIEPLM